MLRASCGEGQREKDWRRLRDERVTRAFVAELCNGDDQARDDEPAHCIQPESDLPLAGKAAALTAAALTAAAHCAMRHSHSGPTQSQCEGPMAQCGALRRANRRT